jgi:hypothetical protein
LPRKNKYAGFEVFTMVVMESTIFWDITPCSPLKFNRRFGGTYRLHLQGLLATCFHAGFLLAYFSTLKMEAICSSETTFHFQQTTRAYIPEDGTIKKIKMLPWVLEGCTKTKENLNVDVSR